MQLNTKSKTHFHGEIVMTGLIVFLCAVFCWTCNFSFEVIEPEIPVEICDNGIDDTGNGLTDCEDPECADDPACAPAEICDSGLDDDGDGWTDCEDPDCADEWFCNAVQPCNDDGICNTFEHPFWCDDCCPDARLNEGDVYEYILSEIIVPTTVEQSQEIGVDLNYDGKIDNGLSRLFIMFPTDTGDSLNNDVHEAMVNGDYIVLSRMYVSSWPSDEASAVQVFQGSSTYDATEDNFTGEGTTHAHPNAERTKYLKGELQDGMLETCPGTIRFPFYLESVIMNLRLEKARFVSTGPLTEYGWEEVMIGGGLNRQTIDNNILPTMLVTLNRRALANPTSTLGNFVFTMMDAKCNTDIPGCEHVVNGEGECSPWSGDPNDPPLTITELKCNTFLQELLKPDIDSNGDGEKDLLSMGFKVKAIRISILN